MAGGFKTMAITAEYGDILTQTIQILLIDDHELFRAGLRHLVRDIGTSIDFHEAETVEAALTKHFEAQPELILLDYHLPFVTGVDALRAVKNHFTSSTVVILSGDQNALRIREAIDDGAAGYIPKSISHAAFLAAVKLVIAGEVYIPKQAIADIALLGDVQSYESSQNTNGTVPALNGLTDRQQSSLLLAIKGIPNKDIARQLDISEGTVKAHLSAAYKVLKVRNRTEAVLRFAEINAQKTV